MSIYLSGVFFVLLVLMYDVVYNRSEERSVGKEGKTSRCVCSEHIK